MGSPQTVSFPVFGDLHLGYDEEAWENARGALRDAIELGPDILLFAGDVVNEDKRYWALFDRLMEISPSLQFLVSRGNADYAAGGEPAWRQHIGKPVRTVLDMGHLRFVTLGAATIDHEMSLGEDIATYLRSAADQVPERTVVVLCHAPVKDTTFWSCNNTEDGCLASLLPPDNPPYHLYLRTSDAVRAALAACPNIRLFLTGHVHSDHRMTCDHGYGPIVEQDGVIHIVTANLGGWRALGVDRCEYRWFDIDEETIRVRVRDFVSRLWVQPLERVFPLRGERS